jgi:acetyl-CoA carboxylase biotin carboxylase subunit
MFHKVLVANRGEIAVRILRALREMSIASVAVYSDADRAALHVRMADEAAHVGPASASESYLRIDRILAAAKLHGADAIHPGYGFLSENPAFAEACESEKIAFIGPSPEAIRIMASKTAARTLAMSLNVPVVPGTEEPVQDVEHAREIARRIGYPVMLKAAAGGGGKGMRRVDSEAELESALRNASSEAERAFSDSAVYIEKLVERPRHIEIQILGDRQGNLVHLGERECSIQRRHQKVIEESPSPFVAAHPELRDAMGEASVKIARAVNYHNAGTMEFLVDANGNFYFLEMNTRLQVEHPVTELVTGYDMVQLQIRIAAGEELPFSQDGVSWRGSAIECRIYAEDPNNNFMPSPGTMPHMTQPSGPGVRVDNGVYPGWKVPIEYDPMLAKLIVWAETRDLAIARLKSALAEYYVSGIQTNLAFFRGIVEDPKFRDGDLHTEFLNEYLPVSEPEKTPDRDAVAALVAAVFSIDEKKTVGEFRTNSSHWLTVGRQRSLR